MDRSVILLKTQPTFRSGDVREQYFRAFRFSVKRNNEIDPAQKMHPRHELCRDVLLSYGVAEGSHDDASLTGCSGTSGKLFRPKK